MVNGGLRSLVKFRAFLALIALVVFVSVSLAVWAFIPLPPFFIFSGFQPPLPSVAVNVHLDGTGEAFVVKQPGDFLELEIVSPGDQNIFFSDPVDGLSLVSGVCGLQDEEGLIPVESGSNKCVYYVDENALNGVYYPFYVGEDQIAKIVRVVHSPEVLYLTNKQKLLERYNGDPEVNDLIADAYAQANEKQGIVYDLNFYLDEHPFPSYTAYTRDPLNPVDVNNEYALEVAFFINEKCNGCEDVVIVGDDFVVPHYVLDYQWLVQEWNWIPWWQEEHTETNYIFTDQAFVPTVDNMSFAGLDGVFVGEQVTFVLPGDGSLSPEMEYQVNVLRNNLSTLFDVLSFDEVASSEVGCNSQDPRIVGKALVIIGSYEENQALHCLPWFPLEDEFISIERNVWGSGFGEKKYALILSTDDSRVLMFFNVMLEEGMLEHSKARRLAAIETSLQSCELFGVIPGVDTLGDACAIVNDCGHVMATWISGTDNHHSAENDYDYGMWCVADVGFLFVPVGSSKVVKMAKNHLDGVGLLGKGVRTIRFGKELKKMGYSFEVIRIASKGWGKRGFVRRLDKGLAKDITEYVDRVGAHFDKDAISDEFEEQLISIGRTKEKWIKTVIRDGDEVVVELDQTVVLARGVPEGPHQRGWLHIEYRNHHNDIKDAFSLPDNQHSVRERILEVVEDGTWDSEREVMVKAFPNHEGKLQEVVVVVGNQRLGQVITAHPGRVLS